MKVVINTCFGGFGLSHQAVLAYAKTKDIKLVWEEKFGLKHYCTDLEKMNQTYFSVYHILRNDPDLIAIVEKLGNKSFGKAAQLMVIEIPDGISWSIEEYDGVESIHENHRSWP